MALGSAALTNLYDRDRIITLKNMNERTLIIEKFCFHFTTKVKFKMKLFVNVDNFLSVILSIYRCILIIK